ncbi:unnamed protein product [Cuscuta europaea]|uniref:Uncharacterized protein n=1 Tax=Cuscuta europaea TaxID=41803 RepID=A0A9P1EKK0_CUSEU|nr:unnamed protein product [Cuscuta europaea]
MITLAQVYVTSYGLLVAGYGIRIDSVHKLMKAYARVYLFASWILVGAGILYTSFGLKVDYSNGLCSITHPAIYSSEDLFGWC